MHVFFICIYIYTYTCHSQWKSCLIISLEVSPFPFPGLLSKSEFNSPSSCRGCASLVCGFIRSHTGRYSSGCAYCQIVFEKLLWANNCTSVKTVLFHSLIPKIKREWHNLEQIQIWLRTAASYSGDPSDNKAHQKTFNLDNLGILMLQWLQYQSPTTHTDTTHIYICTFILAVVYTTTPS